MTDAAKMPIAEKTHVAMHCNTTAHLPGSKSQRTSLMERLGNEPWSALLGAGGWGAYLAASSILTLDLT